MNQETIDNLDKIEKILFSNTEKIIQNKKKQEDVNELIKLIQFVSHMKTYTSIMLNEYEKNIISQHHDIDERRTSS